MSGRAIGIDIGGTKIAAALFDAEGRQQAQSEAPTPATYEELLHVCQNLVAPLEAQAGRASIGVCAPYADEKICVNLPYLAGKNFSKDLEHLFLRPVPLANDANCAALAEAVEGAGKHYGAVFGLIMGTGIGGGFVYHRKLLIGANGLSGEIGHLPLPYDDDATAERISCSCGQKGCIEKHIAGSGLARLHLRMTGKEADARMIALQATAGEPEALKTLDHYYTLVAKAMTVILHSFDPDIITVSGGLNALPGLYSEVPQRWGRYAIAKNPRTILAPASFGSRAGLHGAAWLGRASS